MPTINDLAINAVSAEIIGGFTIYGAIMLKNALEPQCFKWWEFPSIPGYYFSVRIFPDNSKSILFMKKPADMTQFGESVFEAAYQNKDVMEADWCVLEADLDHYDWADSWLSEEQLRTIYKHFGIPTNDGFQVKEKPKLNLRAAACNGIRLLIGRIANSEDPELKFLLKSDWYAYELMEELLAGGFEECLERPVRMKPIVGLRKDGVELFGADKKHAVACTYDSDADSLRFSPKINREVYVRELGRRLQDAGMIEIHDDLGDDVFFWCLNEDFFPEIKTWEEDEIQATLVCRDEGVVNCTFNGQVPFNLAFDLKKDIAKYYHQVKAELCKEPSVK